MQAVDLGIGENMAALIDVIATARGGLRVLIILGRVSGVEAEIGGRAEAESVLAEDRHQIQTRLHVRDEITLGARGGREDVVVEALVQL